MKTYPLSIFSPLLPPLANSSFQELPLGLGAMRRVELSGLLSSSLTELELPVFNMSLLYGRRQMFGHQIGAVVGTVDLDEWHELLGNLLLAPTYVHISVTHLTDALSLGDALGGRRIEVQVLCP